MNLSVKEKSLFLGCLLMGFQAFSQTCPVPPNGVQQGQFTITPNGGAAATIVGHANGNTPLVICPGPSPATVANTTVMGAGVIGYYYYPFNPANTANPPMPTAGGARYPPNNRFQFTVNTPGKYTIVQTTRSSTGAVLTYACKVVEIPPVNTPVAEITSCAAGKVTVEIANVSINQTFDSFEINWGDAANPATNIETFTNNKTNPNTKKTHTYPNNGTFTINIKGVVNGQTCFQQLTRSISANGVGANPITNPATGLAVGNLVVNTETEIQLTNNLARNYELFQSADGGANFQSLGDTYLSTVPKLLTVANASRQQYCYKVRQKNTCGSASADSDINCSIPVESVVGNKEITINWKQIPGGKFTTQQVVGGTPSGALGAAINTYNDKNRLCQVYNYYVFAFKTTAPAMTSRSLILQVQGRDDTVPDKITNAFLTVNANNKVELRATYPATAMAPIKEVSFLRTNNTSHVVPTPSTSQNIEDPQSEPDKQQQCYKISYKNNCSVSSLPSDEFCAVYLKPTASGIEWTEYKKFTNGLLRYEIEVKNGAAFTTLKRLDANTFSYQPAPAEIDPANGEVRYRIRAVPTTGTASISNETVFAPKATLFVPEAFTPNNDGKNDRFDISGYFIKDFSLKVYNRWGITVFETDKFGVGKGWDGKLNNSSEMAPIGTYVYEYSVTDYKEQTEKKKGYFFLMQ
jgi:gliding motility-associated-like protein